MVVLGHLSFTFEHLDQDSGLVIGISGKGLGLLGGNGSVSWNKDSHDTTCSLDTEGEGGNVK